MPQAPDAPTETFVAVGTLIGMVGGVIRGRAIGMQTDQVWGVVRPQPAPDVAVIAVGVVAAALIDAIAGFLPQGTVPGRPISPLQVRCSRAILPDAPGAWARAPLTAHRPGASDMPTEPSLIMIQFLQWVADRPRSREDVMDAWRSSCPRFPVWEDARADGLIRQCGGDRGEHRVELTERGRAALRRTDIRPRSTRDQAAASGSGP